MANCTNCNGCSGRGCTRVGALGTLCRAGCRRNPYYTGPCPSAPCTDNCGNCSCGCDCGKCCRRASVNCSACGCHCNHCDHCGCNNGCSGCNCGNHCGACDDCDDCDDCDRRRGGDYGIFALSGSVNLNAGDAAEFSPRDVNPDCFVCRGGCIVIRKPGLYRAALTADIPRFAEASAVLNLELNGKNIPAAEIAVDANDCASAMNYTAEAIFEAKAGDKLRTRASGALNIGCADNRNILRLTVYRI